MARLDPPKIYADFQNADAKGRVRLNCAGTRQDLARQQIELRGGGVLLLYSDDADEEGRPDELRVPGVVEYSADERLWVAAVDWSAVRRASDERAGPPNVPPPAPSASSPTSIPSAAD